MLFANRYLDALECWRNNRPLTESWKIALDATKQKSFLTLQHLLLGINAHINLDLGIAAVETMQGQQMQDIHQDFDTINSIISSLTYQVLHDINQISPLISLLGFEEGHTESILIQFSIDNAWDGAWCFAEALAPLTGDAKTSCIAARDKDISTLARQLIDSRGFVRLTVWLIHLFEWKSPRRIMGILNNYKKTFIKVKH